MNANREYKDRLFKFIFGNPDHKDWTLSLYNAVNGSSYTDPEQIRLTTIEGVVYMSMRNDVSFLIEEVMSFYEQQATYNPNMPVRFLIYSGMVYSWYMEAEASFHPFSTRQQRLPVPKFICFYNGTAQQPESTVLQLLDSFPEGAEADIDVRVTMLNINAGHNQALMDACRPLREYAWFVASVRAGQAAGKSLEEAVDETIAEMPETDLIKPFLVTNKAEVKRMSITEYDEERTLRETLEDGIEIGEARGLKIGEARGLKIGEARGFKIGEARGLETGRSEERRKTIRNLMTKMGLTMDQAMDFMEIPESEREMLMAER